MKEIKGYVVVTPNGEIVWSCFDINIDSCFDRFRRIWDVDSLELKSLSYRIVPATLTVEI